MRFKDFIKEEYIPTKKEVRKFDLVDSGFGEVAEYEELVEDIRNYKDKLKQPYEMQLRYILNNSKELRELLYHLRRYVETIPEKIKSDLNKIRSKYEKI